MYYYCCIQEEQILPDTGCYTTFGIAALQRAKGRWRKLFSISDVSLDRHFVQGLANLCTRYQLSPCHLLDVVEDTI